MVEKSVSSVLHRLKRLLPTLYSCIVLYLWQFSFCAFQVGISVVTYGPYWSGDCQGMLATVVKALDSETMTVQWEVEWSSKAGKLRKVGTLTTYKLFPTAPHARGKPAFRYLCA